MSTALKHFVVASVEGRAEDEEHPQLGKPFRVKVQVRNNRLIRAREQLGYMTQAAAASGTGIGQGYINKFETFSESPVSKKTGMWRGIAERLALAYNQPCEALWPECIALIEQSSFVIEAGPAEVAALSAAADPEARLRLIEAATVAKEALQCLTPQQREVFSLRFGLEGKEEHSQGEVAELLKLSRTRIWQIEQRAFRAINTRVSNSKMLQEFFDGGRPTKRLDSLAEVAEVIARPKFTIKTAAEAAAEASVERNRREIQERLARRAKNKEVVAAALAKDSLERYVAWVQQKIRNTR
jgi:RNA polymerase sigma factor (sigma-70 family)